MAQTLADVLAAFEARMDAKLAAAVQPQAAPAAPAPAAKGKGKVAATVAQVAQAQAAPAPVAGGVAVTIAGTTLTTSPERTFSSGSRGYNMVGKVLINGKRYQLSGNLVEIGSK